MSVLHTHLADSKCSQQATGMRAADGSDLVIIMFFWNNKKIRWQVIAQAFVSALVTSLPLKKEHFGRKNMPVWWLNLAQVRGLVPEWNYDDYSTEQRHVKKLIFLTDMSVQPSSAAACAMKQGRVVQQVWFKSQVLSIKSRPTSAGHFGKSWCLRVDFH